MRILAPQIGISPGSCLGGTITDGAFLYGLADRGHEIEILLPEGESVESHPNIHFSFIPQSCLLQRSYLINFYFLPRMRHLIQEKEFQIIRIHSPYSLGITAPLAKTFSSRKPRLWYSFLHLESRKDWFILDKLLPYFADGITCISEDTRDDLRKRFSGLDRKLTRVTPLGVNSSLFKRPLENKANGLFPFESDRPLVLFIGSLIERKGIPEVFQTWDLVAKHFPEAQLVLVGQGPLQRKVGQFVTTHPNVFHIPQLAHCKLPELYSKADVFFLPTRKEGFGLVVAEAMSCELPVVTTEAFGVRQLVVEGETGFKCPVGAIKQFAERLLYLLRNPEVGRECGKRGRERVKRYFTWDHGISATESFIEELVKKSN